MEVYQTVVNGVTTEHTIITVEDFRSKAVLYNSAPVTVVFTRDAVEQNQETTITALKVDAGTGRIQAQLEDVIDISGGLTDVKVIYDTGLEDCTTTVQRPRVLMPIYQGLSEKQVARMNEGMKNLSWNFISYKQDYEHQANQETQCERTFPIAPNTIGVQCLTPQTGKLTSVFDNMDQYQYSIDGVELTDIPVEVGDGVAANELTGADNPLLRNHPALVDRTLHNYNLEKFYKNVGRELKRYDTPIDNLNEILADYDGQMHTSYPAITPLTKGTKNLSFQLSQNSNQNPDRVRAKTLYFYEHQLRKLEIKNGKAKVL